MKQFNLAELNLTPFLFFTGKGGVGKTSTACATAIALADQGKKILLVSTDPASNLQDVFGITLTNKPKQVPSVSNLFVANLDPETAALEYKEKIIGPYRDKLPEALVNQMEEQLSGACTVEIAAFDEFTSLLTNKNLIDQYDHIIFDTAPTGHTLRLLQLPTAWNGFLEESTHGASCLGPLAGLADKKKSYEATVQALSDIKQTILILVTRPDESPLNEAARASLELKELGISNQLLVINGLLSDKIIDDEISIAFYERQQSALEKIPNDLKELPQYIIPLMPFNVTGIENLRKMFHYNQFTLVKPVDDMDISYEVFNTLIDDLIQQDQRVVFTMGKGGVGKTTIAAAIAVALAERGKKVHLTTTDPAAHLEYVMKENEQHSNLSVSKIDPKLEIQNYKQEVLSSSMEMLDEEGLAYLEEDLRSPCTEEIAVFRKFAEIVEKANDEIIVIDTAPTGHTLLLLDATQTYHQEIQRSQGDVPESVKNLLPRLRNPKETTVVIVTLAEATPVFEANRLKQDLLRASIQPKWWVINQSLYATKTIDPILSGRASSEAQWIKEVQKYSSNNCVIVPWQKHEIKGYEELQKLTIK
ncbi:arsenical pump-driving ATPase [Gottfriedia acidiceleris]|uniref:Arsenical pump-driving ATPase n=1 Tax=Gottfriedia acidiceleris TaxID=371036 RepID=A0ABY4JTL7_9BACI|nr:arsenical pump-driving ATPase [Gottfriedia acidiceleris]UPM56148.1 arsenical pump-driving ATPase [Gottfriedia acidiceleris]